MSFLTRSRCARWAVVVFAFCATTVWAQSIQTYAGGGTDDGQLATDISMHGPRGLAYDPAGNLYVVEQNSSLVRRIDINGIVHTLAGNSGAGYSGDGGLARNATLNHPAGLALDRNGDLYIADTDNNRVRRISGSTGIITNVAGNGSSFPDSNGSIGDGKAAVDAAVIRPWAVALYQGSLYVTEFGYLGQRVRKVDLTSGVITTIAGPQDGSEGFEGDGGPATKAKLSNPLAIIFDTAGNAFISDSYNDRVRRIDAVTGNIETYAGGGTPADGVGDGGPATAAKIPLPTGLAFDAGGNLLITSSPDGRIRRVDKTTRVISTVVRTNFGLSYFFTINASGTPIISSDGYGGILRPDGDSVVMLAGGGSYIGDGLNAKAGILHNPSGLAIDAKGNLFVADSDNLRIRRVDATTGVITTFAGKGAYYDDPSDDGTSALTAPMYPVDVALAANGDLYICDAGNGRIKKVDSSGILTFYAGGGNPPNGNNDGVAAKSAKFGYMTAICFDAAGNLYVADQDTSRVWRIDAKSGIVKAFAGNGTNGFSGDGGPATSAQIDHPVGLAGDSKGNIYISDNYNGRIRRVGPDGVISTIAGDGSDQGLAVEHIAVDPRNDEVYIADHFRSIVWKVDSAGNLKIVAGAGGPYYYGTDYQGDGGPALAALMNFPYQLSGLAISKAGDLFISDTRNNRIRAVLSCAAVTAPSLTAPANGASGIGTAPVLSWSDVAKAFRYDLRLDTVNPPQKIVASDLSENSFVPSNLAAGTKYYWQVVAKGDPFCPTQSTASSSIATFTTGTSCATSAAVLTSPADGATTSSPVVLTWQPASGAASYDVYFGSANPPSLVASGVTSTTYTANAAGGRYYWFIVAHAACDSTRTAASEVRSFSTQSTTCTPGQIGVTTSAPVNGGSDQPLAVDLKWSSSGAVEIYDVYFGTDANPPLRFSNVSATTQNVASLRPATKYYWRVVARGPCDPNGVTSATVSFTTRNCSAPGPVSIDFAPGTVSAGSTYTIVWSQAAGADEDAGYLVERSATADFASPDVQVTSSTAASFIANTSGTYYHRVRAVAGCDVNIAGSVSAVRAVTVVPGRPNVVFTQQPNAVITGLGEHLEDSFTSFALENLGGDPVQVIVGRQELSGAPPFFSIADPAGGDASFVTLRPHEPRVFNVRFSGPKNDAVASYQGVIFVASTGQGLAVTPYAFVNLKVGGAPSAAPQFMVAGVPSQYAAFPGFSGDDGARPPLEVGVKNNGGTPVEVGFEIGPEVWLSADATWNATRIEPGTTRSLKLTTRRAQAPNGSALPRYTYLTVRTKDGASSRLLVQDNDDITVTNGRNIRLDASARSFIIPEAVSRADASSIVATRIRLANIGSDAVQAEMLFTPAGADGFDTANVRRATVVVPANDAVTITDPLAQIFRVARPAAGQIEIRLPRERIGLVSASAATLAFAGSGSYAVPVINRGEGAIPGAPHVLPGIVKSVSLVSSLVLAETSGIDHAAVRVTLISAAGLSLGTVDSDVPRYGYVRFDDVVTACGATAADAARLDIRVTAGGGSVTGLAIVHAPGSVSGASLSSVPASGSAGSSAVAQIMRRAAPQVSGSGRKARGLENAAATTPGISIVVPVVGPATSSGAAPAYKTSLGLTAPAGNAIDFVLTFRGAASVAKTVNVLGGTTKSFQDVIGDLFALPATSQGSIFVDAPEGSLVHATLAAANGGVPSTFIPLPTSVSEALTSASSAARPLYVEGLEQSTDSTRGSRTILMLNEIAGASGTVQILLYESGNRSTPIAAREFAIAPFQQLQLDTVFAQLGLDTPPRRKDRANVQAVVVATRGSARIAASAIAIDNATGETKVTALAPAVGSGPPGVSVVSAVIPKSEPPQPSRRRVAKH